MFIVLPSRSIVEALDRTHAPDCDRDDHPVDGGERVIAVRLGRHRGCGSHRSAAGHRQPRAAALLDRAGRISATSSSVLRASNAGVFADAGGFADPGAPVNIRAPLTTSMSITPQRIVRHELHVDSARCSSVAPLVRFSIATDHRPAVAVGTYGSGLR
jgi:hypothetical protein